MSSVKTISELMLSFGSMSNKKIQKICYYAYSWYLTLYGSSWHLFSLKPGFTDRCLESYITTISHTAGVIFLSITVS